MQRSGGAKGRLSAYLRERPAVQARARGAYIAFWKRRVALGEYLAGAPAELPRVLQVDPARVRLGGVGWTPGGGRVRPGDWDLSAMPLAESDPYQAARSEVEGATAAHAAALAAELRADSGAWVRVGR